MFPDAEFESIESSGGRFEVTLDGRLIYSKLETGEFPRYGEIPKTVMEAALE